MSARLCSLAGCGRAYYGRGWCKAHYGRWRLHGDPSAELPIGRAIAATRAWADPEDRARRVAAVAEAMRKAYADPEVRARMADAMRAAYTDPALRARVAEARRNAPVLGVCAYCLGPAQSMDHVLPRSRGGTDDPANLVPACYGCNSAKGARTPDEWLASLTRRRLPGPLERLFGIDPARPAPLDVPVSPPRRHDAPSSGTVGTTAPVRADRARFYATVPEEDHHRA